MSGDVRRRGGGPEVHKMDDGEGPAVPRITPADRKNKGEFNDSEAHFAFETLQAALNDPVKRAQALASLNQSQASRNLAAGRNIDYEGDSDGSNKEGLLASLLCCRRRSGESITSELVGHELQSKKEKEAEAAAEKKVSATWLNTDSADAFQRNQKKPGGTSFNEVKQKYMKHEYAYSGGTTMADVMKRQAGARDDPRKLTGMTSTSTEDVLHKSGSPRKRENAAAAAKLKQSKEDAWWNE